VSGLRETRSVCSFCGVGCGVIVQSEGARIVGVRGDPEHPANRGALCSKGSALHETVDLPDRLLFPLARAAKGARPERATWDTALDRIAAAIRQALAFRGPDAVGFYLSGQLLTEDYYAFNKLAKGFLGTNQIDSNSRLCMSSAASAYQRAFGVDGPPACYEDIALADVALVVGSNMAWCHPVLYRQLEEAREQRKGRPALIVLDPRRTPTAELADLHVPLALGTDAVFLMGLLAELARRGRIDRAYIGAHTQGFAALDVALAEYPRERIARECAIAPDVLMSAAERIAGAERLLSLWAMGVNQSAHGTDTANALIDLHLATGQLGRPGCGPFSLTGQPNAMGGRETGAMATLLPAHRDLASPADRDEVAALWNSPPLAPNPGRTAVELFEHAAEGGLDVLWIAATNPAVTLPDQHRVRRALERTPLVILQDVVASTETARFADLLLPAAGWGEKSGTMTNTERCVSRVRPSLAPPGEARPDWRAPADVAKRLGFSAAFAWVSDAEIWDEHVATTRGRDCDMTGMTRARLEHGPLQWPCPAPDHPGTPRLYTDACFPTPSGRARFVVPHGLGPAEARSPGAPLALTTIRVRDQWHTMTRTGAVPRLLRSAPEPRLELSPDDAAALGLETGDRARVHSARASFEMQVAVTDAVPPGTVAAPIHWSGDSARDPRVNFATHAALDPHSKQPELKHSAVRVEKIAARAPGLELDPGAEVVCACHGVTRGDLERAIERGARTPAALGLRTRAGLACATCVPELRVLLKRARAPLRETVVVVGNGMVGHRLVEKLVEQDGARRLHVVALGEEPRPAYDRVHLSELFGKRGAAELALGDAVTYAGWNVDLLLDTRAVAIDRTERCVATADGRRIPYDKLVLATGSAPFVPPVPGVDLPGVFVYRTIEDVDAIRAHAREAKTGVVIGGGLLGLEAAKALLDLGLETHVVEAAPRLMPRQLDELGAAALARRIEALGVRVHTGAQTSAIRALPRLEDAEDGADAGPLADDPAFADADTPRPRLALRCADGRELRADLVVISAGIRPRDELARAAELVCGERGGIAVDDSLRTNDPRIFAVGEAAAHRGAIYGLVSPGYAMADALAANLVAGDGVEAARFSGADLSTQLKLLGVDVASFGDPFAGGEEARAVTFQDLGRDVYARLVVDVRDGRLRGGILVGDTSQYPRLLQLHREGKRVPERPDELLFGASGSAEAGDSDDAALVCSCNNVCAGALRAAIRAGQRELGALKQTTKAGTGCGGCLPLVSAILAAERQAQGDAAATGLCEHFRHTRQELYEIAKVTGTKTFAALVASHGRGAGCEVCKPAVASILSSLWNEPIQSHAEIQDTNDRFLANIQRGGTYSVVPRIPGGEITPEKLIVLGSVAKKYRLYCKITGGQRIDLLGARVDQLPDIWRELVDAGFESGHAYGKAMRTVKSCVGSTWCRFGVQDSTALAIRLEERYRGLRAPHKLKSAVSGCIRECAEAQSKDFGVIATEKGWNLYVCGNGGSKPRHAELLAADLDEETLVRYVDRFLMYYVKTADRLTRTARWLESLPGGIEYLRKVVIEDHLGIAAELERQMQFLVETYECEWAQVVRDPALQRRFRHFADSAEPDPSLAFVEERGQRRPADWPKDPASAPQERSLPSALAEWVPVASAAEVPRDGGIAVRYGETQLALFHVAATDSWYATENRCPHTRDAVLARGIVGDQHGRPKVACPLHKKTFDLATGAGLSDPELCVATFPARVEEGKVFVKLPRPELVGQRSDS
jgi:NAD(P)H-dependent nitrite reductase large subunit/NAD(P)H-dependent nitrite reductase small subunit